MMSVPWINVTSKLHQGVQLLNSLPRPKFNLLLKRIIQSETDEIFTQAELTKLGETLKLDASQTQLLVQSLAHIFKQSSKVILKPTTLQEQLVEKLKLQEELADDFVKLWTQETKRNFDVENSKNLEDLSWELNLESASNFCNKEQRINARLRLGLASVDGKSKENLTLELNKKELEDFYTILENIQSKLDTF